MRLEDLFEKRERTIFQLISLLQDQPASPFIKDLSQQLGISRTTLLRYIDTFHQDCQEAGLGLILQVRGEQLVYHRPAELAFQAYLGFFAQSSIKYQILTYLFDREDFTIQGLSQKLLISEASLSRQLSSLNQLLEEFGLSIRSGRLKGSELQIRYFYYQLFWQLGGGSIGDFAQLKQFQLPSLTLLERLFDDTFTHRQVDQLLLWLVIGQKRMRLSQLDFEDLYEKMTPYQTHKFYDRLRQLVFTLFGQLAGGVREGEVMSLFVFLFFNFMLGAPQVEQMLAFGGPIKEATTLGLAYLRELKPDRLVLDEEALYHLNQLFGQIYFFKGQILPWGDCRAVSHDLRYYKEAQTIYQEVAQKVYGQDLLGGDFEHYICLELEKLFHYITVKIPSHILIGLCLSGKRVDSLPLLNHLRKELEQNRYITIEEWQEGVTYDLVISDYRRFDGQAFYLLYQGVSRLDIMALKNLIKTISKAKVERPIYRRTGSRLSY